MDFPLLLTERLPESSTGEILEIKPGDRVTLEELRSLQERDPEFPRWQEKMEVQGDCWLFKGVPFIPSKLRDRVLSSYHGQGIHFGIRKTVELMKPVVFWPGMETDVKSFVKKCNVCQVGKAQAPQEAPIQLFKAPERPFQRILCTRHEKADIVDIATGRTVLRLESEENNYNGYLNNRAAFSPDDEMVLNDGLLWDVRSAKPIHKFDKFNSLVNGVFHPLGLEILSSSEVWDIRTFLLLHSVPSMDGCYPTFTSTGDVFFAFRHYDSEAMGDCETSFRSYDARDYSMIATTDVRKVVVDLGVDPRDQHLAVVENSWDEGSGLDSIVRVYEIGREAQVENF
ncbi:unnamed protein product [Cyprideis torosa]|uniref:Integrase zinc-binding domain-containing protein n=1 Tax=Cyprideis torosa TaxID=163714 RepID=A0A7R8ZJB6_9CRUS|nr:unnamed protein product [Cyprideis torosa]CAG0886564.1 unnamed protein product [Cyprideis torosa]